MGFLKGLGKGAGFAFGAVVGGATYLAGTALNSKAIQEVGEGVLTASTKAGETIGTVAGGVVDVVGGTFSDDPKKVDRGFGEIGIAVTDTAIGIKHGVTSIVENGGKIVEGIKEDNFELIKEGGINIAKTAAVATLAIGVADYVGIVGDDVPEGDTTPDGQEAAAENPNTHHVQPHWVNEYDRADGTHVEGYFRDGDGNTSVNTGTGWEQHNPNFTATAMDNPISAPVSTENIPVNVMSTEQLTNHLSVDNPNMHHVDPHYVEGHFRADGTYVDGYIRDGDGDSSVNTGIGYMQHNPDFKTKL